ncbi:gastrokine-1 [Panthera uncia]|uniref:gastrokine-1 n=1 Tax=Panthera uncia TaxID=29064 RepID=UPI0020FF9F44|nr:gastrokine-1 [Panthera uncia]
METNVLEYERLVTRVIHHTTIIEVLVKEAILFAGLLGVFLTPALAFTKCGLKSPSISCKFQDINIGGASNSGTSGQQSVSVNNEHNVANIDNNNGWDSWNALWDYNTNFAAIRLFKKKVCIVHRMNKDVMPSLHTLDAMVKEKKLQGKGPGGPPPTSLIYSINPERVSDLEKLGKPIAGMCRGIPTYTADEIEGASLFFYSKACLRADILWILRISLCGELEV